MFKITGAFLRVLVPSWASFFICLGAAIVLLAIQTLVGAWDSGLLFPSLLGQDSEAWPSVALIYIAPLVESLFSNNIVAVSTVAVMWGVLGAVGYLFFARIAKAVRGFHTKNHPSVRFYAELITWHLFLIALAGLLLWLAWPLVPWLLTQGDLFGQAASLGALLQTGSLYLLGWIFLLHCGVILIRLYRNFYLF